ncbi:MAG: FeoB-associated Cys-rich membrane protein [Pseudomonadota bacterium]
MNNISIFCILVAILGGAIWYIISQKKKGNKCIGCSCGSSCACDGKETCGGNKDC